MAVRAKLFEPGFIYFVTFTICEWQAVFTDQRSTDFIYKWFDYQRNNYANKIHGYVVMPNHFHGLIFVSPASPPLNRLIQNAKRFLAYGIVDLLHQDERHDILEIFARKARRKNSANYKVFEERYDSKIIDNADLYLQKLQYIHNNPCKPPWNLAETPEGYLHSSAADYLGGKGAYEHVEILY